MRKKLLVFAAAMLCITGCEKAGDNVIGSTTETTALISSEETNTDDATDVDTTVEETTTETETTAALPEDERGLSEKYLDLMSLDLAEARSYFGVDENSDLTSADFDEFLNELLLAYVGSDQLSVAQRLKDPEAFGVDMGSLTYDPGSSIVTEEDRQLTIEITIEELNELLAYPYDKLTVRQQLTFDKLYYNELISLWGAEVKDYSSSVASGNGLVPNLAITFYEFTFDSEDSVKIYDRVMEYVPDLILEVYTDVQLKIDELGYYPTDGMLDENIEAIKELLELDNNPFIQGYNDKIDALALGEASAKTYKENNEKFYKDEIVPALESLRKKLMGLKGKNKDNTLPISLEGGKEYYEYLFEKALGGQITVEEGFILLSNKTGSAYKALQIYVMRCYDEYMDYYNGVLKTSYDSLAPNEIMEKLMEKLAEEYPGLGDVNYTITALPKSLEQDGILAYYIVPRLDASETNIIRYNSSGRIESIPQFVATLAHEGYPGHMLQFNLEKNSDCYGIERLIDHLGYSEGWAMSITKDIFDTLEVSNTLAKTLRCDYDVNYYVMGLADIAFNGLGYTTEDFSDYLEEIGLVGMGDYAQNLFDAVTGDPASYIPYTLGRLLADQTIDDYVDESGTTKLEARASFCEIGPAPFKIVQKYMGTEF